MDGSFEKLDLQQIKNIDRVLDKYGKELPFHLVDLTHSTGTPWSKNYEENANNEIPKEDIKSYYKILLGATVGLLTPSSRKILEDFASR